MRVEPTPRRAGDRATALKTAAGPEVNLNRGESVESLVLTLWNPFAGVSARDRAEEVTHTDRTRAPRIQRSPGRMSQAHPPVSGDDLGRRRARFERWLTVSATNV